MKHIFTTFICLGLLSACATNDAEVEQQYSYDRYAGLSSSQRDPASIVSTMMSPIENRVA